MRPTWGDVRRFCLRQGYKVREGEHTHFDKPIPNRGNSWTMISHGADRETIGDDLWNIIWRHQLRLASETEFWRGIDGESVQYASQATEHPPSPPMPPYLIHFLQSKLYYAEEQIAAITEDEARRLMNEYYSREILED